MRTFKGTLAAILLAILAGCSPMAKGLIAQTYADIKTANDTLAAGFLSASCGMSHGAYERLPSGDKLAVDALECGKR